MMLGIEPNTIICLGSLKSLGKQIFLQFLACQLKGTVWLLRFFRLFCHIIRI